MFFEIAPISLFSLIFSSLPFNIPFKFLMLKIKMPWLKLLLFCCDVFFQIINIFITDSWIYTDAALSIFHKKSRLLLNNIWFHCVKAESVRFTRADSNIFATDYHLPGRCVYLVWYDPIPDTSSWCSDCCNVHSV